MSREQVVRDTAYAIWDAEGKPEGRHEQHWREAEARVDASLAVLGQDETKDGESAAPGASGGKPKRGKS